MKTDIGSTPIVEGEQTFATAPMGSSAPDSITIGGGSIWVEYGNGANSMGTPPGSSTIVQYSMKGQVENTYTSMGLADGLKYDPVTGNVWVLNNNDGNSTLQFINPATAQISAPLQYDSGYVYGSTSSRGFDDVVFDGNRVFLSETNPANPGDPVIVQLLNGQAPFGTLKTTAILSLGDTGTNLVTGQTHQTLPMTDPDSLKVLPNGELLLTGEADGAYIFVKNPGTAHQTESFVQLPAGNTPDDAIMPTSRSGTFYISNQGANDIISVKVTGLNTNDLYADITSKNELVQIDPRTGAITPIVTGLNSPHGLAFVPSVSDAETPKLSDSSEFSGTRGSGHGGDSGNEQDADHGMRKRQPDHIVVVIEENHDADQIIGSSNAPYINGTLVKDGLYYSNAHGTDHPSQPNYLELFSGANPGVQGVNSPLQQHYPAGTESTPAAQYALAHGDDYNTGQPFSVPNLGAELLAAGKSFAGYSEDLPLVGFTSVDNGTSGINGNRSYVEKHNPWAQFQGSGPNQLPADTNQPFTAFQSISDFSKLPTVSFVVPNEYNDMHDTVSKNGLYADPSTPGFDKFGAPVNGDSTIQNGDTWLKNNLEAYRQWATTHDSLLVTVWDENDYDFTDPNNIPMIVDGDPRLVQPGVNSSYVNHFDLLNTLEGYYGLAPTGKAATADGLPSGSNGKLIPDHGDGNDTANIALLRNYMASSFAAPSNGHGGTLVSDPGTTQQPLVAQPHA
ncbi:MAG TPA: alkaline phosphatase family protein [Steroidobacteraceae bacterium]|nr:alkaline phosphatase family protein [Steroidobacteraceae bacterium]